MRLLKSCALWIRGPSPPTDLSQLSPWLDSTPNFKGRRFTPSLESKTLFLFRKFRQKWLLLLFGIAYIISLVFIVRADWFLVPAESFVGCTSSFWSPDDGCGLDGQLCLPFESDQPIQFRCPAQCAPVQLLNIRAVGEQEVVYQPLVVGGGDLQQTYRGDSWICASAIQSGVISNSKGGCGAIQLVGSFTSFVGTKAHGMSSVSFNSTFPLSYRLSPSNALSSCTDLHTPALIFNIFVTIILFIFLRPAPLVLFWSLVCIGYWHVIFFSDPAGSPPPLSNAFGSFLPALFITYAFWLHAFRYVFPAFDDMPLERAFWYLVPFWCGVLINSITARLPLDRLVLSDIRAQPGALTCLLVIIAVIFVIVVNQILVIRRTGWLPKYLMYYAIGGVVLLILAMLPGLSLRLHHYFFSMLLIPGTAFPTRLSAAYQGILLGIFLDGAGRWGFDSVLQTAAELQRDAPLGTSLPSFLTNSTNPLANISSTIIWKSIEAANVTSQGWNGFSLLVDDVERYSGLALNFSLAGLSLAATVPHYFRLAYQNDGTSGDYTRAATFFPNGTFADPLPGPS